MTLRPIVPVAAATLALAFASPAQSETLFVGSAMVSARTSQCGNSVVTGDFGRMTYRPSGAALGNGGDSNLAFLTSRASYSMNVPGGRFQFGVNYGGQSVNSQLTITPKAGGVTQWVQAPQNIGPSTPNLDITASIANFFGITGCSVTFQMSLLNAG